MCWKAVLCVVLSLGWASPAIAVGDERAQLAAQRQQIEARARQALAACAAKFDVVGCEDAARRERSAALAPLQQREHELADLERKQRAEQQQQRVRDKLREAELQSLQRTVAEASSAASAPIAAASRSAAQPSRRNRPDAKALELARQEQAQRSAERAERQRLRSLERRQRLAERQAEKASRAAAAAKSAQVTAPADARRATTPAAGLPVPTVAEVAALRASAASSKPRP